MAFIGNDVPVIPSRPMVGSNGTDVQIVWDAAVAQHDDYDGNLAPVSYRVVRRPDGHVVAEATTALSATDHIDAEYKSRYTYDITPVSGEIAGEAVSTRPFYAGSYFALPHDDDLMMGCSSASIPKLMRTRTATPGGSIPQKDALFILQAQQMLPIFFA